MDQERETLLPNPRNKAGFLSKLTFWWLVPLLWEGHRRPLQARDLYEVQPCDASDKLARQMQGHWEEEQAAAKASGRPASYARALIRCFGCRYLCVGLLACIEECVLRLSQPVFLGWLLRHYEGAEAPISDPNWCALAIVAVALVHIFVYHPFNFLCRQLSLQARTASCSLIYRKALRLSKASLGKTTVGQMVNLLSNDVNRFDTSVVFLNYLWIGPIQLSIVTGLLWAELGPACMAGIMLLVLFIPLQSWMGKVFSRLRLATALRTDERVRIMNEIVNAMRVIKMYTWEIPFTQLVEEARKREIGVIMKTNYYRAVNMSLFFTSSKIVVFLSLLTFVLTGQVLTAEKVFVTSSLINNVRLVMTLFFPFGIAMGSETLISCRRIQEFLQMEEIETSTKVDHQIKPRGRQKCGVELFDVTARWAGESMVNTLERVSCSIFAGQLLAVIGPVGAGKGSLLQAILGELPVNKGSITVRGKIAYASQEPWVFSGTLKKNIVFGQPFNEKKYSEVIRVCGLEEDLVQLPYGDQTLVGDRGVSLSGGQKARVNLARAIYYDADVYLLDDPLSAVDAHVGRHLFEQCILGHLQNKVCILVTHQLQYLRAATDILVLKEGRVEAYGSYTTLANSGVDFASLMDDDQEEQQLSQACHGHLESFKRSGSMMSSRSVGSLNSLHMIGDVNTLMSVSALSVSGSCSSIEHISHIAAEEHEGAHISMDEKPIRDELKGQPKVEEEVRSTGSVSAKMYLCYFLMGGGWCLFILLLVANVITQVLFSATDYWLSYWTNGEQLRANGTLPSDSEDYLDLPPAEGYLDTTTNVYIYTSLTMGLFTLSLCRTILFFVMCMTASKNLHNRMFAAVIRCPISYFDTHPIAK